MDREEKLKAAREKLKRFQQEKMRLKESGSSPVSHTEDECNSEPQQSPGSTVNNDLPVFTFASLPSDPLVDPFSCKESVSSTVSGLSEQISGLLASSAARNMSNSDLNDHWLPEMNPGAIQLQLDETLRSKQQLEQQLTSESATVQHLESRCQALAHELAVAQAAKAEEVADLKGQLEAKIGVLESLLASHSETISILVAEKSEVEAALSRAKLDLDTSMGELLELKAIRDDQEAHERSALEASRDKEQKLLAELQALRLERDKEHDELIDLRQQVHELNSKLARQETELSQMSSENAKQASKLELAEVNLAQLRSSSSSDQDDNVALLAEKQKELERLTAENEEHTQRVSELAAYIQQAAADREQIILQYTSYSQQLTNQIEALSQQLSASLQDNHRLASREKELLAHVQQLEQLMQGSDHAPRPDPLNESHVDTEANARIQDLSAQVDQLVNDKEQLHSTILALEAKIGEANAILARKEEDLNELEAQLEMAQITSPDVSQQDLVAACQSDKVAASRAMLQNQELKEQLQELQSAFIQITNSKAQLVNDFDTLQNQKVKLDEEGQALKSQLAGLQSAIAERDRSIIHMKEQMQYYIAFAENSINGHLDSKPRQPDADKEKMQSLLDQLQVAREEIRSLSSRNSELRSQLEVLSSRTQDGCDTPGPSGSASSSQSLVSSLGSESPTPAANVHSDDTASSADVVASLDVTNGENGVPEEEPDSIQKRTSDLTDVPVLSEKVALLKLEHKFKQAMQRIAELSSERDHLDHLVVQLQEETDTVGDYITIYQYQRQQQKKRLQEKELQLQQVSRDREELKSKLMQLQSLITDFVQQPQPAAPTDSPDPVITNVEQAEDALTPQHEKTDQNELTEVSDCQSISTATAASQTSSNDQGTADRILALISEIESNQMLSNAVNFHPWFWEPSPGKMMVV